MVSRLKLVQGICRIVGVDRKRPASKDLDKKELHAVFAHLNLAEQEKALSKAGKKGG